MVEIDQSEWVVSPPTQPPRTIAAFMSLGAAGVRTGEPCVSHDTWNERVDLVPTDDTCQKYYVACPKQTQTMKISTKAKQKYGN